MAQNRDELLAGYRKAVKGLRDEEARYLTYSLLAYDINTISFCPFFNTYFLLLLLIRASSRHSYATYPIFVYNVYKYIDLYIF